MSPGSNPLLVITALICLQAGIAVAAQAPTAAAPPKNPPPRPATLKPSPILDEALRGRLSHISDVVFVTRTPGTDPHWYANFGYWSEDSNRMLYGTGGSRLCRLNLRTKQVTTLIDEPNGTIRDPHMHYGGQKILFSYRKSDSRYFNLYEINSDGSGLHQITSGPWDDIEPIYLPNGEIVFCSSRCKRWVNCWFTQVAVMFRCDADGNNLHPISANTEHDNTPAVLPDGRLLYTRWEYVDRSQVEFHHLWVTNPDGTAATTYFGNLHPGGLFIDSKPIPGTKRVLSIFSPGHGSNEHKGVLTIVDPDLGPDDKNAALTVQGCPTSVRDPYPLTQSLFLVARKNDLLLVDSSVGKFDIVYSDRQELHEPIPVLARPVEPVIPDRVKLSQSTGRFVLADAHLGRNMEGVQPGQITKLLILESLPKPINFSGGPNPLTWLGTFTLERIVGTVPVEADGSAYFELPANRQFFFVALDKNDLSIKRMQSWTSVAPGETTGCVGCHEQRIQNAPNKSRPLAIGRLPSQVQPLAGMPDVIDYPRHIQPILDQQCVSCHSFDKPEGGIILTGDHGVQFSHSYWMLIASNQVADGRNGYGNRAPRTIGSSASKLLGKIDGSHYAVKATPDQWRMLWMWIESGATYSGTYASLGTGQLGVGLFGDLANPTGPRPQAFNIIQRRCYTCHSLPGGGKIELPAAPAARTTGKAAYERIIRDPEPLLRRGGQILYNLTRPEKSFLLLAPLAKSAGGFESCKSAVFKDTTDPDYQALLAVIRRSSQHLDTIKRFDMPGFRPNLEYLREMKRFGILPANFDPQHDPVDPYRLDRAYWQSLWWSATTNN